MKLALHDSVRVIRSHSEAAMSEITIADVKKRAEVAGLTLRADRVEMVRKLLSEALKPVQQLDSCAIQMHEPAVTFDATGGRDA